MKFAIKLLHFFHSQSLRKQTISWFFYWRQTHRRICQALTEMSAISTNNQKFSPKWVYFSNCWDGSVWKTLQSILIIRLNELICFGSLITDKGIVSSPIVAQLTRVLYSRIFMLWNRWIPHRTWWPVRCRAKIGTFSLVWKVPNTLFYLKRG